MSASDFDTSGPGAIGDTALIARLREGDAGALDTLVHAYGPALVRYARRVVVSPDAARDVVQDVFLDLWRERASLEITRDIAAYLFWRTRNRALNVRRTELAARQREERWVTELRRESADLTNAGERSVDAEDTRREVWNALAGVSPRSREIFMLVWDHHLSYDEIAQRLGISVSTVRSQMSRALRRVIDVLGERGA